MNLIFLVWLSSGVFGPDKFVADRVLLYFIINNDSLCFNFKLQRKVPFVYMKILSVGIFIKSHALNTS
jgi:hypothetical protein